MAEAQKEKNGVLEKIAAFLVDRRKAIYLIYIVLVIFCFFSSGWVKVNNTLTDYLAQDTETRQGLAIMDAEFMTYATASVMVDTVSYAKAQVLAEELAHIDGVKNVTFDDTDKHYADGSALFSITFSGAADDPVSAQALSDIETHLADYDTHISAELGNTKAETIAAEIRIVLIIAAVIILSVLFLTSRTYMEIPVLILTFVLAAILNKGTNYMLGTISFVSNSIAVILQLALAIDYAIILCHRYQEERQTHENREAVIRALCKAIPEISGSCLTTLSGLAAMSFMHFRLGYDMGVVLIKAILLSILSVFTFMPGLLVTFGKGIDKTHHKNFVPKIDVWGRIIVKLRYVAVPLFACVLVAAFFLANRCPYVYSYAFLSTITKNDAEIAKEKIDATFRSSNPLAILVPTGDYEKEKLLLEDLEGYSEFDSVMGLANIEATGGYAVADKLTPRQFAELTDMEIEKARLIYAAYAVNHADYGHLVGGIDTYGIPLIDLFSYLYDRVHEGYVTPDDDTMQRLDEINNALEDGRLQLKGAHYSRIVTDLNLPEEGEETFAFLSVVRDTAKKYFGNDVYLVGNSTSDRDLAATFGNDNTLISILTVLLVMVVLLFTFQSAGIPVILILVIQGSVWMNFSFPTLRQSPLFFLSYLVVSSIQMGANIDYAIVITNRFSVLKQEMSADKAVVEAVSQAFPTILTSGSILASAGFVIGLLSSDPAISSIGLCLGRGTLISIVLVMGILPQLLMLGDKIIERTSFRLKPAIQSKNLSGIMRIDGHVHGYVNGRVDGTFSGMIRGDMDAIVQNGEMIHDKEMKNHEEK